MSGTGVFEGMRMGAIFYGGLYTDVAAEGGAAKALAMHGKQCEGTGTMMTEAIRAPLADQEATPHALMCDAATAAQAGAMSRLLPQLSLRLEVRKTSDDVYLEIYELKE